MAETVPLSTVPSASWISESARISGARRAPATWRAIAANFAAREAPERFWTLKAAMETSPGRAGAATSGRSPPGSRPGGAVSSRRQAAKA